MANLSGKSLGRYHLIERLGEGGMAVVYKAFDTRLETDVAVKVIRTEKLTEETKERALKRFEREAKALARLTHPNIVKVTDYGDYEGKPYLVMPLLAGGTLKRRLGKPVPWEEAFQILTPIARALEYAHQRDIIHRDVKPSNILITDSGQPMISDFGVAKILTLEETVDLTGTGMGIGTPEFMAPEQWTGDTTPLSDQYSLGVVLYEMITGRKPYTADTPAAILLKQATEPLPRPSSLVSDLPEKAEKILFKTLARDPKDRYKDMGELARALEGALRTSTPPVKRVNQQTVQKLEEKTLDTLATVDQDWEETHTPQAVSLQKREARTKASQPVPKKNQESHLLLYMILGLGVLVSCILTVGTILINNYRKNAALSSPPNLTMQPVDQVLTQRPNQTNDLLGAIQKRGYILVSTDPNYEPQSFLNTSGSRPSDTKCPSDALTTAEMQGFDVDVAIAIGTALGVETCFATPDWDIITAGSWADKWDLSVGSMTVTTARQQILDFSTPYYYNPAVIAVRDDSGLASQADLEGQALCVGSATTYDQWLSGDIEGLGLPESSIYAQPPSNVTIVPLPTDQECTQAIVAGHQDFVGYVTSETVVNANIAAGLPIVKLGSAIYSEDLAVALDKSSSLPTANLMVEVNRIIEQMHSDGTLTNLSLKWFGEDITQTPN